MTWGSDMSVGAEIGQQTCMLLDGNRLVHLLPLSLPQLKSFRSNVCVCVCVRVCVRASKNNGTMNVSSFMLSQVRSVLVSFDAGVIFQV